MATRERPWPQEGTSAHASATRRRNMEFDEEYYALMHSGQGRCGTAANTLEEQCRGRKRSAVHEGWYSTPKQTRLQCDAAASTLANRVPRGTEATRPTFETRDAKQNCSKRPRQEATVPGIACSQHSGQQLDDGGIMRCRYKRAKNSHQELLPISRQHHACNGAAQPFCCTVHWLQQ